jgi:hypothetical protein
MNLVVRAGDTLDIGASATRQTYHIDFGEQVESVAGPDDGRACPINDRGEIAFHATWNPVFSVPSDATACSSRARVSP